MSEWADHKFRAALLREAASAIVAENDRVMWATKPGKHWAADLLNGMAATSDAVVEQGALPMPVGSEPRTLDQVEDELTGVNLSLYEEELLTARLRLALASAQRGRRELRAGVAETKGALVAAVKAAEGSVVELRREHEENARLRAQISELETERRVTNEALDDAVQELRRRDAPPSQAKPTLSTEAAVIVAAGPLCSCIRFPAAHRADMHDENWQVRDIEPIPSEGWSQMKHAKCTRCGWISKDSWLRFDNWVIQTRIAEMHRHRWTDECLPDAGSAPSLEDPHDGPLAHTYRLGRDLPEMGSV
jgi:hypothetical protein